MRAILRENTANYILLERLMNVDYGKKNYELLVFLIPEKKIANNRKITVYHSIEFIGYQIQAHWQNNCILLITKDQSSKVCKHFSIF